VTDDDGGDDRTGPSRGIWMAWGLALLGGLAVLVGVVVALLDPCLQDGRSLTSDSCVGTVTPTLVTGLALGGTVLAVVGGLSATVLTLRRPRPEPLR
jgi:hypothetical protein